LPHQLIRYIFISPKGSVFAPTSPPAKISVHFTTFIVLYRKHSNGIKSWRCSFIGRASAECRGIIDIAVMRCCPNPARSLPSTPIPPPCRHSSPNYHHRIDLGTLHHPVLRLLAAVRQIASGKSTVALHYGADNTTQNMMIWCYAMKQQDCFD